MEKEELRKLVFTEKKNKHSFTGKGTFEGICLTGNEPLSPGHLTYLVDELRLPAIHGILTDGGKTTDFRLTITLPFNIEFKGFKKSEEITLYYKIEDNE